MKVRILADGDEESLGDLQSWLSADPGTARLGVTEVAGDGRTMGVLEALDIILGNAADMGSFALAYASWRSVKRDEQSGPADGEAGARTLVHGDSTVDIGHLTPEELADLLRRLNGTGATGADE
ncbi:effector-associated constant component EACC1 [Streptomyces cinerochromogenes]|uniref:effector-associated constant component EACC1 n=1 Tax=Streptomyces cinerochromogenes TaxID=66422 RepID=UPI0033A6CCCF